MAHDAVDIYYLGIDLHNIKKGFDPVTKDKLTWNKRFERDYKGHFTFDYINKVIGKEETRKVEGIVKLVTHHADRLHLLVFDEHGLTVAHFTGIPQKFKAVHKGIVCKDKEAELKIMV